jgi:N-acetyl-gamma-glutamyl-phosphate reductase
LDAGLRVIDLSADFRIKDVAVYAEFYGEPHHAPDLAAISVYGLAEVYREAIRGAQLVASPGCYPTSILLPLIPLLKAGLVDARTIHVSSMSGVSGAGRNAKVEYLYAECNESVRAYGVPKHRHLAEIEQELSYAAGEPVVISFTPHLTPVTRGIHSTIYAQLRPGVVPDSVGQALESAYAGARFVRLLRGAALPDTKNVTNITNQTLVNSLLAKSRMYFFPQSFITILILRGSIQIGNVAATEIQKGLVNQRNHR